MLNKNKAATPLAVGGGRSNNALFAHMHFGKAENFAWASNLCFYLIGNCAISYKVKTVYLQEVDGFCRNCRLIICLLDFKVSLGMEAGGANLGSGSTNCNVTAVAAFPILNSALFKYFLCFYIVKKSAVSFFVSLFNCGNSTELCGKLLKAFFLGVLCHIIVHICPFVIFAFCCVKKIFSSITKLSKVLKPKLCVLFFVFGGFKEKLCNLLIACLFCNRCKLCILVSCMRFACKGFPKIFLCFCSCINVFSHKNFHNLSAHKL